MMWSRSAAAVMLLLLVTAADASSPGVGDIRQRYRQVKEDIAMGVGPYVTELVVNAEDLSYPAVGHYQEWITFHWESQAGYNWPVLVEWTSEHSAMPVHGELLFSASGVDEQGSAEAVFMFLSAFDNDGNLTEYRWWWSGGELLQASGKTFLPDGEVVQFVPEDPSSYTYTKTPERLAELFEYIHG